jgi:hypothetical protein
MFLVLLTSQIYAARAGRTPRSLGVAAVAGVFAVEAVVNELTFRLLVDQREGR